MKVAILTMFNGLSTTYSLVNVVAEHLHMLLDNNIAVKMIVTENCSDNEKWGIFLDERIEWVKIKNTLNGKQIELFDYSTPDKKLHHTFYEEADMFAAEFIDVLQDVDVCMMHDILYQGWHYVHNIAIRKAQPNLPKVKFIAFAHSFPANRPIVVPEKMSGRYTGMDNTVFVYPSQSGISALAKQYHIPEGKCRVIYNTVPIIEYLSKDVKTLHDNVDLLSSEVLIVYAGRFSTGKKFEKVAALAGSFKRMNEKTVKVIFCDFPCMDTPQQEYKDAIRYVGEFYGLDANDIVFTSENGYPNGFPREAVLDLFTLSNLYICPSFSETFGLTVVEAASRGNFIVVNKCVPALEEIGKILGAYFMEWDARNYGFDTKQSYHPSEKSYYDEKSVEIGRLMRENNAIMAKTMSRMRFGISWVWENQLKPLIEQ
ncbi:glycosyltransferase [Oscillospiraceae bacterium PP1C4]